MYWRGSCCRNILSIKKTNLEAWAMLAFSAHLLIMPLTYYYRSEKACAPIRLKFEGHED